MTLRLPSLLETCAEIEYGLSKIVLDEQGRLEACDPYGCIRLRIPLSGKVHIVPVPAVSRPQQLTECLYVEFAEPIVFGGETSDLWFLALFELAVIYEEKTIAKISPTKAKLTLVGDLADGVVCRYHKSVAGFTRDAIASYVEPGLGFVRAEVGGDAAIIPGIGFYVRGAPLYVDQESRVYYPIVEVFVSKGLAQNKTNTVPPIRELEIASRGRPYTLLPTLVQPIPGANG